MSHYVNYEEKALQLMGYTINDCQDVDLYWTVFNHRKMWIYIAETYAKYLGKEIVRIKHIPSVIKIKEDYIASGVSGKYRIHNNCFLCDYVTNMNCFPPCDSCPLLWDNNNIFKNCSSSYYGAIYDKDTMSNDHKVKQKILKKMVKLAYKIADLPERTINRKELTINQKVACALMNHLTKEMTKCITTT